ncbi:hypothetical protein CRYUN_Cryun22dG0061800 [Craigia yunnanensis]
MGSKKPFLVALLVHALSSGMILLSKAAFNMGMSMSVFVFYRQVAGVIFLVPFAMVFEGMEMVTVKTVPGIAKVAGILVCMAGVVTLAFYKGPVLKPLFHLHFQPHSKGQDDHHASSGTTWILGCFLLLVSCICWALWLVLQVVHVEKILKPCTLNT